METGNNLSSASLVSEFFDLTFSDEPATNYFLLLEFADKTIKACWYHKSKNLVTGFAVYLIDWQSKNKSLNSLLESHPFLVSDFDQTIISFVSNSFNLYPSNAGIKANNQTFSVTNELKEKSGALLSHKLVSGKTEIQFEVSKTILADIDIHFPKRVLVPHIAARIEHGLIALKKSILTNQLCAHIENDSITILAFENRQLIFSNAFYQTGKEDIAYYILYVADVIGFDNEKIDLIVSGDIEIGDNKWNVLTAYWKRIKVAEPLTGIDISTKLLDRSSSMFDYLTHLLLCA